MSRPTIFKVGLSSFAALAIAALPTLASAQADTEIRVLVSGGFYNAYQELSRDFENQTGISVSTEYGQSLPGNPSSIPDRLARGEPADLVILAREPLDDLVSEGLLIQGSEIDLGLSPIALAVGEEQSAPDISTSEAFVAVLEDAASIGVSSSASGVYLIDELFTSLEGGGEILAKTVVIRDKLVGEALSAGEVEIGFQQLSELTAISGITLVGPIPDELQKITRFSLALVTASANRAAAGQFAAYLASDEAEPVIEGTGLIVP